MRNRKTALLFVLVGIIGWCIILIIVASQTRVLQNVYDNFLLDNENHYLPCDQYPSAAEVERVLSEHQDLIREIEQVHPGQVGVEVDASTCPGRADLLFWYASHSDRLAIKALIGAETFFGIPYRMQNR